MPEYNSKNIGENLDKIRDLLNVPEGPSTKTNDIDFAWYVGANIDNQDCTDEFITYGRWENGYDDKYKDEVNSINVGDRIVLKSTSRRKTGCPFDNRGKLAGYALIKAIGIVTSNPQDGKHLSVEWKKFDEPKCWYTFTGFIRDTLNLVKASAGPTKKALLDFTFGEGKQDYSICENYYCDEEENESVPDEIIDTDALVEILKEWLVKLPIEGGKMSTLVAFGIKYGFELDANNIKSENILSLAGETATISAYMDRGRDVYRAIKAGDFSFSVDEPANATCHLPKFEKRKRSDFPLNTILYGAPGTGKTYATAQYALAIVENKDVKTIATELRSDVMNRYNRLVTDGQIVFTTFHQNYGYEDFIQGIRPDTSSKEMSFKTVDGVFKKITDKAMQCPEKDYVIIIDEINRANISKVFGELITLIEDDKRWGEENAINATLPSGETFAIPNNLYIVGTMNSADKSISLIDAALRRRFEFVEYVPNLSLISDVQLRSVLKKLNDGIAEELGSTDLLVGHSYFMHKSADDICDIMNRSIIPLLYEYFFDNQKKVEAQIKKATEGLNVEVKSGSMGRIKLVKKDAE